MYEIVIELKNDQFQTMRLKNNEVQQTIINIIDRNL